MLSIFSASFYKHNFHFLFFHNCLHFLLNQNFQKQQAMASQVFNQDLIDITVVLFPLEAVHLCLSGIHYSRVEHIF